MRRSIARLIGGVVLFTETISFALPVVLSPAKDTTNNVSLGSRLVLSVQAVSTVSALTYQWRFGPTHITGATNSVLVLDSVRASQAGVYSANMADADGSVVSPQRVVLIGPIFTKVLSEPFSTGGGSQSMAWADINQDGWVDVYCANRSSATTTLFTNDTHGSFGRATGTIGASLVNPVGATWGDYDNDGAIDLFIANNNKANDSLLHNNGNGSFTSVTSGSIVSSAGNGNGCAWADYDRDGFIDLFVANSDGNNFLFHNNGNQTFTRISTGPMVSDTSNSQGCCWIDYDGDGFPDLYVSRWGSPNMLFHNNGKGGFTKIISGPIASAGGSALGFCWGDYDNDGSPDLFVANGGTNNFLFHNDGNGSFTRTNPPTGTNGGMFQTANWVDYDNDGWLDLFVTSVESGTACRLYHNNGDGTFSQVFGSPLLTDAGRWFAAAWADVNNDGFPDVLVSNINNPNVLHLNHGNENHWLTVRCLGRVSNRLGIGAKIRVHANIFGRSFWQLREVAAGGNIGNQDQIDPMFGLGDALQVDTLRVEWPSGTIQEFQNVAADQILAIREPAKIEAAYSTATNQLSWILRGGKNITYQIEKTEDLKHWMPWGSLTNVSGQVSFTDDLTNEFRAFRAIEP